MQKHVKTLIFNDIYYTVKILIALLQTELEDSSITWAHIYGSLL